MFTYKYIKCKLYEFEFFPLTTKLLYYSDSTDSLDFKKGTVPFSQPLSLYFFQIIIVLIIIINLL